MSAHPGNRRPFSAQKIERIKQATRKGDQAVLVKYGGLNSALRRHATLKKLPTPRGTHSIPINGYASLAVAPVRRIGISSLKP